MLPFFPRGSLTLKRYEVDDERLVELLETLVEKENGRVTDRTDQSLRFTGTLSGSWRSLGALTVVTTGSVAVEKAEGVVRIVYALNFTSLLLVSLTAFMWLGPFVVTGLLPSLPTVALAFIVFGVVTAYASAYCPIRLRRSLEAMPECS